MDVPREAELRSPLSNEYQSSVVCSVRREDDLDKARKKGREISYTCISIFKALSETTLQQTYLSIYRRTQS